MKKILLLFIIAALKILMADTVNGAEMAQSLAGDYGINGYSIAYSENGEITFQNYGNGIDEKSVFELASNGKVVSAYIALKLVDEGKLCLDEKIAPYLKPDLLTNDIRMNNITLRQLLCHTAGFSPSFEFGVDKKLYSDPGMEFRYSGVGYIYLQSVIENVSGLTMEQAARHYVYKPLGMKNSTFEHTKTVTPYMDLSSAVLYALAVFIIVFIVLLLTASILGKITKFKFYSFQSSMLACLAIASIINVLFLLFTPISKVVIVFLMYIVLIGLAFVFTKKKLKVFYASMPVLTILILILSLTIPASIPVTNDLAAKEANCAYTFKSTSEDMAIFCGELMRQYSRDDKEIKNMFVQAISIDDVNSWGLGIAIESEIEGETYWHSGINPGFQSLIVLYPRQDKYVIILTNSDNGLSFSKDIARIFLGIDGTWDIKR
ncbi:MAG: beta-lactamase family protein [Lachnospiraceae bacterium]|nr:beta-lactamase family protein [Lachnospiraceae bacterium]